MRAALRVNRTRQFRRRWRGPGEAHLLPLSPLRCSAAPHLSRSRHLLPREKSTLALRDGAPGRWWDAIEWKAWPFGTVRRTRLARSTWQVLIYLPDRGGAHHRRRGCFAGCSQNRQTMRPALPAIRAACPKFMANFDLDRIISTHVGYALPATEANVSK